MKDISNEHDNNAEDSRQLNNGAAPDKQEEQDTQIGLPTNRVIRKRLAARTIGVHLSALPPELRAFKKETTGDVYLSRRDLPDKIPLTVFGGDKKVFSRDEVWEFADEAGSKLEWDMLPDTISGKATAMFSTTGQGLYANYGRPSMDFSGFYYDHIRAARQLSGGAVVSQESVLLGPLFIAADTASAAGFTALGHFTRGARLTNKTVLSDIVSTGIYEGSTSWTSAKIGVFTGAKAMRFAAALPIPGVHLAAFPIGFLVGATSAIFVKRFANQYKDRAIDTTLQSVVRSKTPKAAQEVATA